MTFRIPFAILQHGNQYLIADGYDNREGLSEILAAFAAMMTLHRAHRVPLNLHLSGTLIEAIAWWRPEFFDGLRAFYEEGLLEIVGSTYAQNIVSLFDQEHNLRQMNEALDLYARHLNIEPTEVRVFWVPERLWDSDILLPLLTSPRLRNGGFRTVVVDDRLVFAAGDDRDPGARHSFDQAFPYASPYETELRTRHPAPSSYDHLVPFRVDRGGQVSAIAISRELRYCVPPRSASQWADLRAFLDAAPLDTPEPPLCLYADDLEKTVAVGYWGPRPWRPALLESYDRFLGWLRAESRVTPVRISMWLRDNQPRATRAIFPGTYYELAHGSHAGEDYLAWWDSPDWAPFRAWLVEVERELLHAPAHAPGSLWDLAWKHFLACSYETAWHNLGLDRRWHSAPWAKALASHARASHVILAAARWFDTRDGGAHARSADLDYDGHEEIVLSNDHLFAVFAPSQGGRLVYLFESRTPGGALVLGNPTDDWHWQQELNRATDVPRDHLGAFADVGAEHDVHEVAALEARPGRALLRLLNTRGESHLRGAEKTFWIDADGSKLQATYRLPTGCRELSVDMCFSPDYLRILREGRRSVTPVATATARGYRYTNGLIYASHGAGEHVAWEVPAPPETNHAYVMRLVARQEQFDLSVVVAAPDGDVASEDQR